MSISSYPALGAIEKQKQMWRTCNPRLCRLCSGRYLVLSYRLSKETLVSRAPFAPVWMSRHIFPAYATVGDNQSPEAWELLSLRCRIGIYVVSDLLEKVRFSPKK
jgi:hypothetical protein